VAVHPVAFHSVLDLLDAAGWRVRQEADGLTVLLASSGSGVDPPGVGREVTAALAADGAAPAVRMQVVDAIPAGAAGKRPLVVAQRPIASRPWASRREPGPGENTP
jgi:phenylacetate-CoA ligase